MTERGAERTCRCVRLQEIAVRIRQGLEAHGPLLARVTAPSPAVAWRSPLVAGRRARLESLLVRADWPVLLQQLACAVTAEAVRDLSAAPTPLKVAVTSDLKLRVGYFDSGGAKHLDVVAGAALVVVRLGQAAAHKINAAALYETLAAADDASVPVWLVESPSRPFGKGHPSWSEEIGALIEWPRVNLVAAEDDPNDLDLDEVAALAAGGDR